MGKMLSILMFSALWLLVCPPGIAQEDDEPGLENPDHCRAPTNRWELWGSAVPNRVCAAEIEVAVFDPTPVGGVRSILPIDKEYLSVAFRVDITEIYLKPRGLFQLFALVGADEGDQARLMVQLDDQGDHTLIADCPGAAGTVNAGTVPLAARWTGITVVTNDNRDGSTFTLRVLVEDGATLSTSECVSSSEWSSVEIGLLTPPPVERNSVLKLVPSGY